MSKFVKRPVEIEAWPIDELIRLAKLDATLLPPQVLAAFELGTLFFQAACLTVFTLEGPHTYDTNSMLICGVEGELYACRKDIFEKTYRPSEESSGC